MTIDDPAVINVLRSSMIARIATLSRAGRPSINPLYFVYLDNHLWLSTAEWTLAARNVKADSRVTVLFEVEQDHTDHRVLRISGRASVRMDLEVQRSNNRQVLRKYILTPSGILNYVTHVRLLQAMHSYHAQSAQKGLACVIEVTPERVEFLSGGLQG
jgi:general stress protein 26